MTAVDAEPDRSIAKLVRAFRRGLITETELRHNWCWTCFIIFASHLPCFRSLRFLTICVPGYCAIFRRLRRLTTTFQGPSEFCGGTDDLPPHDSDAQAEALRDLVPQLRAWLVSDN